MALFIPRLMIQTISCTNLFSVEIAVTVSSRDLLESTLWAIVNYSFSSSTQIGEFNALKMKLLALFIPRLMVPTISCTNLF